MLIVLALIGNALSGTHTLSALHEPTAPSINNRNLVCYIDIVFRRRAPENYWMYYAKARGQIVLDFYGVTIEGRESIQPKGKCLFKSLSLENRETTMSISGEQALIILDADPGWHLETETRDKRTIRIKAWKSLRAPKIGSSRNRFKVLYATIATAAAAATLSLIILLSGSGD